MSRADRLSFHGRLLRQGEARALLQLLLLVAQNIGGGGGRRRARFSQHARVPSPLLFASRHAPTKKDDTWWRRLPSSAPAFCAEERRRRRFAPSDSSSSSVRLRRRFLPFVCAGASSPSPPCPSGASRRRTRSTHLTSLALAESSPVRLKGDSCPGGRAARPPTKAAGDGGKWYFLFSFSSLRQSRVDRRRERTSATSI
jgi:hypothetical protein